MFPALVSALVRGPKFKGRGRLLDLLLKFADGHVVQSHYGVLMRLRAADYTNRASILGFNHWDYDDVYAEVAQLRPGMAFLDIGANAGLFSLVAGGKVGPDGVVLAFEPNPTVFQDLRANLAANGLANVSLFNAAVGERSGRLRFSSGQAQHTGAGRLDEQGAEEVEVMSFADTPRLLELVGDRPTIVKIDVEGAETQVVKGMVAFLAAGRVETLVVEVDDEMLGRQGATPKQLYDLLDSSGFAPVRGLGSAPHYNEIFRRRA